MRSFAAAGLMALVLAAVVVPAALAAAGGGKPAFHENVADVGLDPNFCGTGKTVAYDGRNTATVWVGETGGDPEQDLKVTFSYRYVLTNPVNGAAVVDEAAGQFVNRIVVGLESGAHTHRFIEPGLRAKLKLAHGRVLTRDAGLLAYEVSFDADDEVVGFELLVDRGSHEAFFSDVWCEEAVAALGL